MAQLAIKGHPTRGSEVIALLEMLGHNNYYNSSADCDSLCFYGDKSTNIIYDDLVIDCYEDEDILVFTLEEFLEKFPYKVGDKVNAPCKGCIKTITSMEWDTYLNTVTYKLDHRIYTNIDQLKVVNDLHPYKEETMEDDNWAKWELPDGYEFQDKDGNIINTRVIKLVKKQPQYPKTYEECCEVLSLCEDGRLYTKGYKASIIQAFQKLLICRYAYWKMAGDWKPDWSDTDQDKYVIEVVKNTITLHTYPWNESNHLLAFPTKEMRDAFYENFKDLIEQCKELLNL